MDKLIYQAYRYSLVICRNRVGKFLAVQEKNNLGWWIPGGKLENNQTFYQAALRQTFQETKIHVNIKGILQIDYGVYSTKNCVRVVYYAEPQSETELPKQVADEESVKACYLSLKQIQGLRWRGTQIYQFPKYLQNGGTIYPLSIFKQKFNQ